MDFAEPHADDTCLDVGSVSTEVIDGRVRELISADLSDLPEQRFTLVIARLALARSADRIATLRALLRVCEGRLVLADLVRTRTGDCSLVERLRDPDGTPARALPELGELTDLARDAGGRVRRLDVFTIERRVDPWLTDCSDAIRIRRELTEELDGGPRTGARPRLIGGELWFAQSWAHLAVEPVR
jgi:hypothetical protein